MIYVSYSICLLSIILILGEIAGNVYAGHIYSKYVKDKMEPTERKDNKWHMIYRLCMYGILFIMGIALRFV